MGVDAELVEAAADARAKATEAHEDLTQARNACQERVETLKGLEERLAADREALAVAMEELGRATGEAAGRLATAVNEAAMAVGGVIDASEELGSYGPMILESTARDLSEGAEALEKLGTSIAEVIKEIQELERSVFEEKVGKVAVEQLQEEGASAAGHLAHERKTRLERLTPALQELMDDAIGLLETTLPHELQKAADTWGFRAEHTADRAAEAFATMSAHADEVAAHCAYQLGARLGVQRDETAAEAVRVAGELQALTSSLTQRREELETALDAVTAGFTAEHEQLRTVATQLEEVRLRWSTFGFLTT
jgi:DNA repair exonuclease SbcCD ATPase subunit